MALQHSEVVPPAQASPSSPTTICPQRGIGTSLRGSAELDNEWIQTPEWWMFPATTQGPPNSSTQTGLKASFTSGL